MHFATTALGLLASAAAASAASVTFVNTDGLSRSVIFTPSPGSDNIETLAIDNFQNKTVQFPDSWEGNFFAHQKGQDAKPGMLGEVRFGGWNGLTYFDVSAIVNPDDKENIKQMWPANKKSPTSGCHKFPCNDAYYLPDDVQTKVTDEVDLKCSLGTGTSPLI
ncbi:uncharacterized protein MAM_00472 [Metarhizium album ARSEF 1941]|uniref:DNase1 protein n=1 Tax=Metarhizium album (strain ARSEF 1941) TaxID=1081103 RepID=A0A0B2X844_METAS|nr:uncharacterized protein MAM_00472 [Metarhizium album ARSEF 1941]KHO01471.1 hypothetical protein MAM_00472 [Metarhizium album ARSEF 1941]